MQYYKLPRKIQINIYLNELRNTYLIIDAWLRSSGFPRINPFFGLVLELGIGSVPNISNPMNSYGD